jgi:hypothetical protein
MGAKKPRRVPQFIGRLFAGEGGVQMMTELRGIYDQTERANVTCAAKPSRIIAASPGVG